MKLTRKQLPSRRVVLATLPCVAGSVYFFGWRCLAMVVAACVVGFTAEWLFCRRRNEPVSEAVFVTAVLYALILPPTVGWHIVVVGVLVAIVVAKELFGGFGRNIFNPAMVGRAFVYVCFPLAMTGAWAPNVWDLPGTQWYGALDRWSTPGTPEAVTGASPLGQSKAAQLEVRRLTAGDAADAKIRQAREHARQVRPGIAPMFWGNLTGTMGVTSAMLILVGGAYLFWTRTANRTIILSVILSCAVLSQVLYSFGVLPSMDAPRALFGGGFLFGAFFMATDPISAPKTFGGRLVVGCMIGTMRVVIASFSVFNGGFMFALLLANMFTPSIDHVFQTLKAKQKARAAATQPAGEGAPS